MINFNNQLFCQESKMHESVKLLHCPLVLLFLGSPDIEKSNASLTKKQYSMRSFKYTPKQYLPCSLTFLYSHIFKLVGINSHFYSMTTTPYEPKVRPLSQSCVLPFHKCTYCGQLLSELPFTCKY